MAIVWSWICWMHKKVLFSVIEIFFFSCRENWKLLFAHNRIRIFNPILSLSISTLWTIVQKDGHEFLEVHLFCHKVKCSIKLVSGAPKHGLWMYILVTLNTSRKTTAFQNTCIAGLHQNEITSTAPTAISLLLFSTDTLNNQTDFTVKYLSAESTV